MSLTLHTGTQSQQGIGCKAVQNNFTNLKERLSTLGLLTMALPEAAFLPDCAAATVIGKVKQIEVRDQAQQSQAATQELPSMELLRRSKGTSNRTSLLPGAPAMMKLRSTPCMQTTADAARPTGPCYHGMITTMRTDQSAHHDASQTQLMHHHHHQLWTKLQASAQAPGMHSASQMTPATHRQDCQLHPDACTSKPSLQQPQSSIKQPVRCARRGHKPSCTPILHCLYWVLPQL